MITKELASELFGVNEKCIKRFNSVIDSFNPQNTISGWISIRPDSTYGSLIIDTVNEYETPYQYIQAMPKLHYPFRTQDDGTRVYTWPNDWTNLEVYEKWDGTNICSYCYKDIEGRVFTTFKTRLTPVAGNSELFGNFVELVNLAMQKEPLFRYPDNTYSVMYELCGYRNPHLVRYTFDISLKPICMRYQMSGNIYPLGECLFTEKDLEYDIDILTNTYNAYREKDNSCIEESQTEQGDFPVEGKVFYVKSLSSDSWVPVKCKPKIIEDIHFARGGVATYKVREACYKALERFPIYEITIENIEEILLEDWHPEAVKCSYDRIVKELSELMKEATRRQAIKQVITGACELEFKPYEKSILMRKLSEYFIGSEMRKVFTSAKAMGLIKENK